MTGKLIQTYTENKKLNCISNVEVKHLLVHFIPILFASPQSLICNESVWFGCGCQCWFNGRWWWCLILLTMMMKIAIFDVGAAAMLFYEGSERELWCRDGTQRRNFLSFWSTAHMAQWWWGGGGLREGGMITISTKRQIADQLAENEIGNCLSKSILTSPPLHSH